MQKRSPSDLVLSRGIRPPHRAMGKKKKGMSPAIEKVLYGKHPMLERPSLEKSRKSAEGGNQERPDSPAVFPDSKTRKDSSTPAPCIVSHATQHFVARGPPCSRINCFLRLVCVHASLLPALLNRLTHPLRVLFPVVFVQVRGFDVCRRPCIRVIEKTVRAVRHTFYPAERNVTLSMLLLLLLFLVARTSGCSSTPQQHHMSDSTGSGECPSTARPWRRRWGGTCH